MEELVLASASPRRRELLEGAGWRVRVAAGAVDERRLEEEGAEAYVERLARAKARGAAGVAGDVVLGADTVVVSGDQILGKPRDAAEAARMLTRLAGGRHTVLTGVCLRRGAAGGEAMERTRVERTEVWFSALSAEMIAEYVESGEPFDKAGGYAIQGRAARFIPRIEGSYSNVVGLPLAAVWEMWREFQ